ncbi:MAG: hypothetical protein LKE48_02630 [Solobacterium sp.]|nr:hypothetical protein [Solobacterium sp.]
MSKSKDIAKYYDLTSEKKYKRRMQQLEKQEACPCSTCKEECRQIGSCDRYRQWNKQTWRMRHN